jgi:hypothetical protein
VPLLRPDLAGAVEARLQDADEQLLPGARGGFIPAFIPFDPPHRLQEGLRDEKVERKYEAALKLRQAAARVQGKRLSPWVRLLRRITRWSSQFTRWLRDAIIHGWEWEVGVTKLRPLMLAYLR